MAEQPPPGAKRGVLFDVFGTLVHFETKRRPFMTLMSELDLDREQRIKARRLLMASSVPSMKAAAMLLASESGVEPQATKIAAAERELEEHLASCRAADGALPLLRELREDGYVLALVSNLASVYVPVLDRLGIRELVDHATYSCEVGLTKPDPAIYHLTLERLDVEPRNAIMVGNSVRADVVGAKAVGLGAVWITSNEDPEHVCLARLADLRSVLE